jgi:hypothetical protein
MDKIASELVRIAEELVDIDDIYEQMVKSGVELDHHESDLYVKKTPESEKIVKGYKFRSNVKVFKNNIDGTMWYDIPFAYTPWWNKAVSNLSGGRIKSI